MEFALWKEKTKKEKYINVERSILRVHIAAKGNARRTYQLYIKKILILKFGHYPMTSRSCLLRVTLKNRKKRGKQLNLGIIPEEIGLLNIL